MAIMLLAFQVTFSQVDDQTVELDEVVLSLPFNQTLGKSVIKVDRINFDDLNPILKQYISKSISKLPGVSIVCLLYTSPSPRDRQKSRMPSSA